MLHLQMRLSLHKLTVDNESENLKNLLLYIVYFDIDFMCIEKKKEVRELSYNITHGEASSTYGGRME